MNDKTFKPENQFILTYGGKEIFSSNKRVEVAEFLQNYTAALSDRELFLQVMTQQWKPKKYSDFDPTYKWFCVYDDGRIHRYTFDYAKANTEKIIGIAPTKELAEKLSEVITGRYRPVKGDILYSLKRDNLKPMSRYDGQAMEENCCDIFFKTYAYFFTASQRDSFARQQEEKREPEPFGFYSDGEILFFGGHFGAKYYGTSLISVDALNELNRIRTELARLSHLLPKETN